MYKSSYRLSILLIIFSKLIYVLPELSIKKIPNIVIYEMTNIEEKLLNNGIIFFIRPLKFFGNEFLFFLLITGFIIFNYLN